VFLYSLQRDFRSSHLLIIFVHKISGGLKPFTWIMIMLIVPATSGLCQDYEKRMQVMPSGHAFDPLILDPVECQSYGALYAYWEGGELQDFIYSPLALGFQLPVLRWTMDGYELEVGFLATVFFQFEFVQPASIFQVNLINTDFKVGVPVVYRKGPFSLRGTLIHVSSHFSEEYIFRHNISGFGENRNTYDAFELHASWDVNRFRLYTGLGMAFNSPHNRGFWKFQGGCLYRRPLRPGAKTNFIAGTDMQVLQETAYSLNTMLGTGFEFALRSNRVFQVLLQFYNGNLPYTQYTHLKVKYLGATLIGHPF
jgi:hypothetical protein